MELETSGNCQWMRSGFQPIFLETSALSEFSIQPHFVDCQLGRRYRSCRQIPTKRDQTQRCPKSRLCDLRQRPASQPPVTSFQLIGYNLEGIDSRAMITDRSWRALALRWPGAIITTRVTYATPRSRSDFIGSTFS